MTNFKLNANELLAASTWTGQHVVKHHSGGDRSINFAFAQNGGSAIGIRTDVFCVLCYDARMFYDMSKDVTDYEAW